MGCENLDSVPSRDLIRKFYRALDLLQTPLENYLIAHQPPPSCIISDKCLSWTSKTAKRFDIPRLVFHGMCCFSLLSSYNVRLYGPHLTVRSEWDPFLIPGMPVTVRIAKAQLPGSFVALPDLDDIRDQMQEAEKKAYGVVVNTFPELEGGCVEEYKKAIDKKVWCIGPVSLCNSQCRLVPAQLIELGLGLEASKHPFIWVIKTGTDRFDELEKWMADENFEERIQGRGLLIKGWAPQVMILSHPAISGFLTHCGWNSTIEGVCSGVPMMTWPMFAEQFLNEKLIVEILRIGVRVGVEFPVRWGEEERVGVVVRRKQVGNAIEMLMGGGEESEKRRIRCEDLRMIAMSKMENGGSENLNISLLIKDIMEQSFVDRHQL
ncbi:hypothetical protein DH2020_026117 [Rehmannia glutinosa]|uniref:Glycosyltransferase n=1 Tax=Rehmannia glutinosa TaxID=99300 RepID=A0ABR0W246_REHGL